MGAAGHIATALDLAKLLVNVSGATNNADPGATCEFARFTVDMGDKFTGGASIRIVG